jgi:chromosome segregation ATPase
MSLKDKLQALNTEALQLENDVKEVNGNHAEMMNQLNQIETFIKDSKKAIEDEATTNAEVEQAYTDLKETLDRLKTEITTLKTQNTQLKNKIASIAGLCIFSGAVLGVAGSLVLTSLKSLIEKYRRTT